MTIEYTRKEDAVAAFFDIRGEDPDEAEVAEAVRDIGDDEAYLPIVKTAETTDDFRSSGWRDHSPGFSVSSQLIVLRKRIGVTRNVRGEHPAYATAYIADCGDYRLVYIDR